MTKPRVLDLFCCQGGAGMGYARAGFDVTGVDIAPQPNYPFAFVQADAMTFPLEGFDVVHASPPCQAYVGLAGDGWPDLLPDVLARLRAWGGTWVVENVPTAPIAGLTLCGKAFGLGVRRHRVFACSEFLIGPPCACGVPGQLRAYYGKPGALAWGDRSWDNVQRRGRPPIYRGTIAQAVADMGIDWMTWDGLREAIPPAYTEHIGRQLVDVLEGATP